MTTYTPDTWEILKIINKKTGETIKKVFAGWYGGFASGDSWKLSSGIIEVKEHDDHYEFHNESGSIYICDKDSRKMSLYMLSVYSVWKSRETDEIFIEITENSL